MKYNEETCAVELSVRELCETALKGGDLGGSNSFDRRALADGAEVHRKLQAQAKGYYNPEVSLCHTAKVGDVYLTVSGRADGVIRHAEGVEVDEIKCVRGKDFFAPPKAVFLAQMKCYAYFLATRDGLSSIHGRLTYYHIETKQTRYFRYRFSTEELAGFYRDLVERILPFARIQILRKTELLPSAAGARFPYTEMREGQEMMIRQTHSAIRRGKRIFVEAPTGTGKTVSALYGAVRALGEGYADKIFYLTAKASTGREAYAASAKLFEAGCRLRTVVMTAREQVCMCGARLVALDGKSRCHSKECELARGYYDRVDRALLELLEGGYGYPRQRILEVAKKHGVCPYELSLELSEYCDIIICDYNYAFDPAVYFRRYFAPDGRGERYVFLIDEAHNLADRARDMYSAVLTRSVFDRLSAQIGDGDEALLQAVLAARMTMSRLRELCREDLVKDAEGNERGFYMSHAPLEQLNGELEILRGRLDEWLRSHRTHALYDAVDTLSSAVRRYLAVNEFFDRGFLCYVAVQDGDILVKTYCLDPSPTMDALLNRAVSAVLFSATLTPTEYFCDVLGGAKHAERLTLPSPFDPEHLGIAVADYLSTRMEDRKKQYGRYAAVIAATVSAKAGNYIAYFPSYACLEGVREAFCRKYPKVEVVVQQQGMGAREREEFLAAFREDRGHLRVGFCVLGGVFSEGVDLPGSRLIGSIVFGVGLPAMSNERNMIQEYFDGTMGQGYDYAYTYPGMTNVLQAVGRVIRRDTDRGVAVLVDDRYATPRYRSLFPHHWEGVLYAGNAISLSEIMHRFWEKGE